MLRLNAPTLLNTLSLEMREALIAALQRRLSDDSCDAVVLAGSGCHFSAGAEAGSARPARDAVACTLRQPLSRLHALVRLIAHAHKPVVAAVQGKAIGSGLSLAIACDAVVAAPDASFSAAFDRVGLVPDAGILYTLPRRVGAARAQRLLLGARTLDAAEALEIGLVDAVVPSAALIEAACSEALRLAATGPLTLASIKSLCAGGCASLEEAFLAEQRLQPLLVLGDASLDGA